MARGVKVIDRYRKIRIHEYRIQLNPALTDIKRLINLFFTIRILLQPIKEIKRKSLSDYEFASILGRILLATGSLGGVQLYDETWTALLLSEAIFGAVNG